MRRRQCATILRLHRSITRHLPCITALHPGRITPLHRVPIIITITGQGITTDMAAIAMAGDVTAGDKCLGMNG